MYFKSIKIIIKKIKFIKLFKEILIINIIKMETTSAQSKKTTAKKAPSKKETSTPEVSTPAVAQEQAPAKKTKGKAAAATEATPVVQSTTEVKDSASSEDVVVVQEFDMNQSVEEFNLLCDKISDFAKSMKEYSLAQKEQRTKVDQLMKKFKKVSMAVDTSFVELCLKQISVSEKHGGSKASSPKKVTDKSKSAVHKKQPTRDILLKFMGLEAGAQVSRAEALNAINSFVREEKEKKNPEIFVEGDNKAFRIIGKLKPLFDGIGEVMKTKGKTEPVPQQIYFTQIMGYMSHCFLSAEEASA